MDNSRIDSIVHLDTCHKFTNTKLAFMLSIRKGENLIEVLTKCAKIVKFSIASLSGIGALKDPVIDCYNINTDKHIHKTFHGLYELINLSGNITKQDSNYITHVHVTLRNLQDSDCKVIGGHLIEAVTGIFADVIVTPLS